MAVIFLGANGGAIRGALPTLTGFFIEYNNHCNDIITAGCSERFDLVSWGKRFLRAARDPLVKVSGRFED